MIHLTRSFWTPTQQICPIRNYRSVMIFQFSSIFTRPKHTVSKVAQDNTTRATESNSHSSRTKQKMKKKFPHYFCHHVAPGWGEEEGSPMGGLQGMGHKLTCKASHLKFTQTNSCGFCNIYRTKQEEWQWHSCSDVNIWLPGEQIPVCVSSFSGEPRQPWGEGRL